MISQANGIRGLGQQGFWDEQQRVENLRNKKPVLQRLSDSIAWESFRLLLNKGYAKERKSSAGRRRIDPLSLFKMLLHRQLFNLIDAERRSKRIACLRVGTKI